MVVLEILLYGIIVFISGALCRNFLFPNNNTHTGHLPPSPRGLPIIGHLHLLNKTPHQSFHRLCTIYGPLIHLRLGSVLCIIASTPELAKQLLITNGLIFSSRPINTVINLLTYNSAGFGFAPYGTYWQFMKKIVSTQLLGEKTLSHLQHIRLDEISQLVSFLLSKANTGEVVNLSQEVGKVSNNIISRMMLSIRFSGEDEKAKEISSLLREATQIIMQFNLSDFVGFLRDTDFQGIKQKAKNIHLRFNDLLEKIMKEREEIRSRGRKNRDHDARDFLDILLDITEDENAKIRVTTENIKALMFDFLTAGTDTSGISVEWAMSELINHPAFLGKAKEEIDSVVGKTRLVQEPDIPNLPYVQAIFKETLRLHPPIPIFERISTQDCNIGGYHIPAKTILFVNNWAISRDPNYWENPLQFQPERFISSDSMIDFRGQHFELLPFGSGRRGCPGVSLAAQVVPSVLALLIQCFDWKIPCSDSRETPTLVDMTERPGLTVPKAHPLMLVPVTRLNPFPI